MAFNSTNKNILEKLSAPRLLPDDLALKFTLFDIPVFDNVSRRSIILSTYKQALIIQHAVVFFCRDDAYEISLTHVRSAIPEWIPTQYHSDICNILLPHTQEYWAMLIDHTSEVRITHDIYLKLWAMGNPQLETDFILIDEAQDSDPIMLQILAKQNCQKIFVGDKHQQIYGFRGAENAMEKLHIAEVRLTQSFRFGQRVADQANLILSTILNETVPLMGNPRMNSEVEYLQNPTAYLVRNNASAFKIGLDLINQEKTVKLEIDEKSLKKNLEDAIYLRNGKDLETSSEFYGFNSWDEAVDFAESTSVDSIASLIKLIDIETPENLLFKLRKLIEIKKTTSKFDCIISTAHKSKGLEFPTVALHSDFKWNDKFKKNNGDKDQDPLMTEDEARLLYVAITRAEKSLDVTSLDEFFQNLESGNY